MSQPCRDGPYELPHPDVSCYATRQISSSMLFRTVALGRLTYTSDGGRVVPIVCVVVWAIDEFRVGHAILWRCGTPSGWSDDCVLGSASDSS